MTKPVSAAERGLKPHYKVRVVLPGAILHLASWDEPHHLGEDWHADWISDPAYGDTIGDIDWSKVIAITWRWTE